MEHAPPTSPLAPVHPDGGYYLPKVSEMNVHESMTDDSSLALWDLDLLDFTVDDHFSLSLQPEESPTISPQLEIPVETSSSDRIRKRDPRLTCSNFIAGRVPCACPELDRKLEEEARGPGKKRPRTARSTHGKAICQVPGCEADIRELKGYHRRHRVCLRCANATAVLVDGDTKRYCQQCGKFHVLSDFDEGKRSCRRKLERHNNRRRRKPNGSVVVVENESQASIQDEDFVSDPDPGKDYSSLISQIDEKEAFLESEDRAPTTLPSVPDSHNIHCSSGKSFGASDGNQVDGIKDNAKFSLSPSSHDNKSAYSSMCPTGRISFKLYDWNPAEFPRRLRHQIFQWLASMPVELEGYIRPGCIILTTFIAMPKSMWVKLLEDPVAHVHDFVVTPGRMLSGRGTMFVYLNNMMFRVIEGAASVTEVKVEVKSPRLHYVHPACFEAGKPMEFFACGSNLQQPKLRFLVSFAGKYLAYDYCVTFPSEEATCSVNHQLYKILIPFTEPDVFGPVFIEVENQSGLSNFIPLLIGSKETCSEMKKMQERLDVSLFPEVIGLSLKSCEFLTLRQKAYMELITDVSWVLKKPASENFHRITSASQIQRFTFLLKFLISNESTFVLEKVFEYLKILMVNVNLSCAENGCTVTDIKQFLKYVECAREVLHLNLQKTGGSMQHLGLSESKRDRDSQSSSNTKLVLAASVTRLHMEAKGNFGKMGGSTIIDKRETVPLTNTDVVMDMTVSQEWSRNSCSHVFSRKSLRPRTTLFSIAFVAICFAICSVLLHPQKVGQLAVSIRRCLFDIY